MSPDPPHEPTDDSKGPLWPEGFPRERRVRVLRRALGLAASERRTKRALFFASTGLLVGFTAAGWLGLLACGLFGGSMYLVVLILRMERHVRAGALEIMESEKRRG